MNMERNELFRVKLQQELIERVNKNSRFSIRAFATQLGIESSSLSQILSGKRRLTDKMCLRLSESLGLSEKERSSLMNTTLSARSGDRALLADDAFQVIADWYHFAILELIRVKNFKGNLRWISRVLSISHSEALAAVERLQRLNYLTIEDDGTWRDNLGSASNEGNEYTSLAFRRLQKQILKKAIEALEQVPYKERVQSSMTMAIDKKKLPQAKEKILGFIEQMNEFLSDSPQLDDVYNLSLSLYPISDSKEKR